MTKKIVTGLASFGMSGRVFHAPLLMAHSGFELKTVVERNNQHAQETYPEINVVHTFKELLADNEIELVIINTPDSTHAELAREALQAGKHVVVEKPFTQQTSQGEMLLNLAKKQSRVLTVFHNRRWDGDFLTVQKIIEEGLLGRIIEFEVRFDRYRNYLQKGSWKESSSSGSGTLYNLGSHLIDQAIVLFGTPKAVTANIRKVRSGSEVDDFFHLILHYRDTQVVLKATYLAKEPGPKYLLNGTYGSFLKFGTDPQEEALKRGEIPGNPDWGHEAKEFWGILNIENDKQPVRQKVETIPGNYLAFYDNLYEAIVNNKPLAVKPQEAVRVIEVIEAALESNQKKETVKLS
jgi:predicted dehydrogenase